VEPTRRSRSQIETCTHGFIEEHIGRSLHGGGPSEVGRLSARSRSPLSKIKIVQKGDRGSAGRIYEEEFLGFSYGFRPKRNQHDRWMTDGRIGPARK